MVGAVVLRNGSVLVGEWVGHSPVTPPGVAIAGLATAATSQLLLFDIPSVGDGECVCMCVSDVGGLAAGVHLVPSRTQQLSPSAPMVLRWRRRGRVGLCQPLHIHLHPLRWLR